MKKKIIIGTRGSKLALIYAKIAEKNINKFKSRFSIKHNTNSSPEIQTFWTHKNVRTLFPKSLELT